MPGRLPGWSPAEAYSKPRDPVELKLRATGRVPAQRNPVPGECVLCSALTTVDPGLWPYEPVCLTCLDGILPRMLRGFAEHRVRPSRFRSFLTLWKCEYCGDCLAPEANAVERLEAWPVAIDHDHKCCPGHRSCGSCVRGIVCRSCNLLYGKGYKGGMLPLRVIVLQRH